MSPCYGPFSHSGRSASECGVVARDDECDCACYGCESGGEEYGVVVRAS